MYNRVTLWPFGRIIVARRAQKIILHWSHCQDGKNLNTSDRLDRVTKYCALVRGFDLAVLEQIVRHSAERYIDIETGRTIVVGSHDNRLVMIAYESVNDDIAPVTVHAITRQQIRFRVQVGRFTNE